MRGRTGMAIGLALAVVYAVTAPRNRTEAEDAYDYAWSVERDGGHAVLHPHHLAYVPAMQGLHAVVRAVAGPVRAHPVMAAVSAGCAGAAVVLLAALLAGPVGVGRGRAWAAAAGLAACYGFWRYAAEAEICAPMLALVLGAWGLAAGARRWQGWVLSGALGGAAVLVHVFASLPVLAAVPLWLWLRRGPRAALFHGLAAAAVVATVYAAAGMSPLGAPGVGAPRAMALHASQGERRPVDGRISDSGRLPESSVRPGQRPGPATDPTGAAGRAGPLARPNGGTVRAASLRTIGDAPPADALAVEGGLRAGSLARAGVGLGQALVSGNFLFAQPRFADAMQARYPARMLEEEVFMGRAARPWMRGVPWATLAALLVAALAWIGTVARGVRRAESNSRQPTANNQQPTMDVQGLEDFGAGGSKGWKAAMAAGAVWFVAHAGLLILTEPGNPELWIAALPSVWVMAAAIGSAARASLKPAVAVAAALAVHNWAGGLALLQDPASDYNATKAATVLSLAGPGDTVVTAGGPVFFRHLRYHSPADVVDAWTGEGRNEISGEWSQVSGAESGGVAAPGRLMVLGDVFAPPPSLEIRFPEAAGRLRAWAAEVRGSAVELRDDAFGGVFRLP